MAPQLENKEKEEVWAEEVADDVQKGDLHEDGQDRHLAVHERSELVGLSQDELTAIDKRTTRKIDILMMPGCEC